METLSEIVAQMRGRGEDGRMDRRLWLDYANRIEAAWKREREADTNSNQNGNAAACTDCMTIDDAISHAEEVANASDTPCARQHRQLADWLLELKRLRKSNDKRCNAAEMRDALEGMCKASQEVFCSFARETFYGERRLDSLGVAFDKAQAVLSAPPRQCDVGTAEEQIDMFREFCQAEKCGRYRCRGGSKSICIDRCAIDWAQTPYEAQEEGAE